MCALCGVLGASNHWTDAAGRPGVFTRNTDSVSRRRERARRVVAANRVLAAFSMRLADWQGTAYVLSTATGKREMVSDLGHLWAAAERLRGAACDPLQPGVIAAMARSHA